MTEPREAGRGTALADRAGVVRTPLTVGAIGNTGWLAVHVACNDIAAGGTIPRWAQLLVLVPRMEDEDLLKQIMQDASRAAAEIDMTIIGRVRGREGVHALHDGDARHYVDIQCEADELARMWVEYGGGQG